MTFVPFTGHFVNNFKDFETKGDFYYTWKEKIKENPSIKAIGGNYGTAPHLAIFDPKIIHEFLFKHDMYIKHPDFFSLLKDVCGNGIVTAEGSIWKRKRKIMSKIFHFEFIKDNISKMYQAADQLLDRIDTSKPNGI
jgi:cytochrome P450